MSAQEFTKEVLFSLQTIAGILGNFYLFSYNLFLSFSGRKLRSKDLIISHLALANSMVILPKSIFQTLRVFGCKNTLSDSECKFFSYMHKVGRGVSISSTCLLSVFQAVTITPVNSRWAELKLKAPIYVTASLFLCWVTHMLLDSMCILFVTSMWTNKNTTEGEEYIYCAFVPLDSTVGSLFAALTAFPDAVCLALMLCSSGSMVFFLYRHKKRVQHIHRNVSPRSSPETRATQTIIVLVSTFVSFHTLSILFNVFVIIYDHPTQLLLTLAALCASCYPTVSPFILLRCDCSTSRPPFA